MLDRNAVVVSPARTPGWRDEPAQEREVRRHALDVGLVAAPPQPVERLVARLARAAISFAIIGS